MPAFPRFVLLAICVLTGLAAAFGAVQAILLPDGRIEITVVRSLVWLFVLVTSIATISSLLAWRRQLGLSHGLAGLALVALGAFGLAWGVQAGLRTGDTEYPILLVEILVVLQGGLMVVAVLLSRARAGRAA